MPVDRQKLEREFFRMLNRVVEPAVRKGIGSPRFVPGGLILLESTGHKSGQTRRTPSPLLVWAATSSSAHSLAIALCG